ncbi:hypothetical protein ACQEVZ_23320 [Dactylosporangium sp. CA-152071]|uniref:hypothetical protein n=1 Tax=Dactylosporangium sp. CA-152071 TaxID=3239933 RepID=UPI003D8B1EB1
MMDALERLAGVGGDLLRRVDRVLIAGGAPAGDPVWELLRRVGALPGDVLEFGLKVRAEPLRVAGAQLRADADRFARRQGKLTVDLAGVWEGTGAEAFAVRWGALASYIGDGGDPGTITGRLRATATYAEALADWCDALRGELAEAVARVVSSTEAVTLRQVDPAALREEPPAADVLEAAARIAVRVLQPAADAFAEARELMARRAPDLEELRYSEPGAGPAGGAAPTTRVTL